MIVLNAFFIFSINLRIFLMKEITKFKTISYKNSEEIDFTDSFKSNHKLSVFKGYSLLKCSSLCSLNINCMYFTYTKQSLKLCFHYSDVATTNNDFIQQLYTKVYKKQNMESNQKITTDSFRIETEITSSLTSTTSTGKSDTVTTVTSSLISSITTNRPSITSLTTTTISNITIFTTTITISSTTIGEYTCFDQICVCSDILR